MNLSEKLLRILRSNTDLSESDLNDITEIEGWNIVYSLKEKKEKQTEICFTGFSPSEKKDLVKIAIENKFHVAKSVTTNLDFLCCGGNAGPAKIKKAEKQNTCVISRANFEKLILTGEIPTVNNNSSK